MTDAPAQLFPDLDLPLTHGVCAEWWTERGIARSSDSKIWLDRGVNPFGGTECRISVPARASREWTPARVDAALRIAAHWWATIGNIDRIDKPLLGHIIQRLKQGRKEAALHIAVRMYARSEWHREKKAWMAPGKFFKDEATVAKWILKSPEWESHVKRTRGTGPLLGSGTSRSGACPPAPGGLLPSSSSSSPASPRPRVSSPEASAVGTLMALPDAELRAAYRQVEADRQAHAAALAAWSSERARIWQLAYDQLDEPTRSRLFDQVEREMARGRRKDGTAVLNYDSDEFRQELHRRAWLQLTSGDTLQANRLAIPPFVAAGATGGSPASAFAPEQIQAEVRRRALAGFRRSTHGGGPNGPPTDAIKAAEQQLITAWMTADHTEPGRVGPVPSGPSPIASPHSRGTLET